MKKLVLAVALVAGFSVPAVAAGAKAEVVERNAQGRATKVMVEGKVYAVCMSDASDNCINPRAAGLNFGNVPLDYWPGKPASQGGK